MLKGAGGNRASDSLALVALYNSTNGRRWTNRWPLAQPINRWHGVRLNGDGRVATLQLSTNGLRGSIPSQLSQLSKLTILLLNLNQLNGPIPSELGNLRELTVLSLNDNQLSGSIPSELGQLSKLTDLNLNGNQLNGSIPSELGQLRELRSLFLNTNQLSGSIPNELGNLTLLTQLFLNTNQLSGFIPSELGELTRLIILSLNSNDLNGSIPSELGMLSELTELYLSDNLLSGSIPSELGNLIQLTRLNLSFNQLDGSIPSEFGNLRQLTRLFLNSNGLSGSIPNQLGNLSELTTLTLSNNFFTELPDLDILNQASGVSFEVQNNHLDFGDILPNIERLTRFVPQRPVREGVRYDLIDRDELLLSVNVGGTGNQYQWYKDEVAIMSSTNDTFRIANVTLSDGGLYHCEITNPDPRVAGLTLQSIADTLSVSYNRLSDSLALIALYNSTDGDNWYNSWNLDESINTWFGVTVSRNRVIRIQLNFNQLDGSIPNQLGNLSELRWLRLPNNRLSGPIPSELGNLIRLTTLELNSNRLSGSIPSELGNLTLLTGLYLNSNQLSGPIPSEFGKLSNLRDLYLSDNFFTELPNLNHLASLATSGNTFEVQNNHLDFGDLLPNIDRLNAFTPQRPVRKGVRYDLNGGDELLLSVNVGGTGNRYQWYKDSVAIMSSTNDTFRIANVIPSDGGLYHCEITNPTNSRVAGLTLESIADTVSVEFSDRSLDSLALVSLYNSTDGDNWVNRWNLADSSINTWHGVTVASDRVTRIELNSNRLSGSIPSELGELSELRTLNLNFNRLSGSIPSELGNLSELRELNINTNLSLSGPIPSELGKLTQLRTLVLSRSQLSGSIPSELGELSELRTLNLNENRLSGSIPSELGNLTQLRTLILVLNQLSGSIPSELGNLILLTRLNLNFNRLSGPIPSELGNLIQLTQLFLNSNQLRGSIPSELGDLTRLRELDLSSNQLSGPIPNELGMLSRLRKLELSNNFFTELPNLNHLRELGLGIGFGFEVQNNHLDFGDLLPNIGRLTVFAPQRPVREGMRYDLTNGDKLLLSVDVGGTGNQYQWYKDSVTIMNSNNDTFRIANVALSDSGLYHCEITNPDPEVAGLTLQSIADTLSVSYNRLSDSLALF